MKVGLNATCFGVRPSGAKQRFIGIYGALVRRLPEVEFVVFEPCDCRVGSWFGDAPNLSVRRTPLVSAGRTRRFIRGVGYWPIAFAREAYDLFEGFNLPLFRPGSGRALLTIHDIRRMRPGWGIMERAAYRPAIGQSLRMADRVITVSEAMKQEILDFFPGLPISVIYNGLDTSVFENISAAELLAVRCKYGLPQEFVLAVGHLERRKNYLRLIDAIARLRDNGCSCCLIIIGNDNGDRKAIEARIRATKLTRNVRILSGLSDLEVRCAYKLCSLFVFPSSYEGFGIPILEAMAAQCPMVLSDIPVFREITRNKGAYFPHRDVEAMASVIERVLSSSSARAHLIEYGNNRIRAFDFPGLAARLESLYRSLF